MTGPRAILRSFTLRQWAWLVLWLATLAALITCDVLFVADLHLSVRAAMDEAFRVIGMYAVARWALGDLLSRGTHQWKRQVSRRRRTAKQDGA